MATWKARLRPSGVETTPAPTWRKAIDAAREIADGDTHAVLMSAPNGRPFTDEWTVRLSDGAIVDDK
ncbi:hypothetical protein AB0I89_24035 [Micromonospora sp. NPDC049801]|uniref:hypothetical protein n=1 Tax=unclassified Micromonospora TaxID=2617518 RepID=UPI0033D767AD